MVGRCRLRCRVVLLALAYSCRLLYNQLALEGGPASAGGLVPVGVDPNVWRGILGLADKLDAPLVIQASRAAWNPAHLLQLPNQPCRHMFACVLKPCAQQKCCSSIQGCPCIGCA